MAEETKVASMVASPLDSASPAVKVEEPSSSLLDECQILLKQVVPDEVMAEATEGLWIGMEQLRKSTKVLGVAFRSNDEKKIAAIKPAYWYDMKKMLWAFNKIPDLKSEQSKKAGIKSILEFIANPTIRFPDEYAQIAKVQIKIFEEQNWGEVLNVKHEIKESEAQTQDGQPPKKNSKRTSTTVASTVTPQQAVTRRPAQNHPIFGNHGIMRGILISQGQTKSYSIDPAFKRDSAVFGHNGLDVGDWWPMQAAALRDGAHGTKMGGIAGTETDGCRSILISKTYDNVDEDKGDRVLYSSTRKSSSAAVKESNGTKALLRSQKTGRPVRVLRKQSGWEGAPSVGIRYDGLYKVVSSRPLEKGDKEFYFQFRLIRLPDQDDIDRSIPSPSQARNYESVGHGY